jgi:hypothetical protein
MLGSDRRYYWSSTSCAGRKGFKWMVGFDEGFVGRDGVKGSYNYVRCVQSGHDGYRRSGP